MVSSCWNRWIVLTLFLGLSVGCGKSVSSDEERDGSKPMEVVGDASFGNQCPYGFTTQLRPVKLRAWDCAMGQDNLELVTPPSPMFLSADCHKKTLTVRSANGKIDATWEVMPDGSFFVSFDGTPLTLGNDGSRRGQCSTRSSIDLFGRLDCTDRDKLRIFFETIWWLGKETNPTAGSANVGPATGRACSVPQGCYLHTQSVIQQCE